MHAPPVERAMVTYARAGESGALWIVLAIAGAAADRRRRPRWLAAAAAVPLTLGLNFCVKLAVARERPRIEHLKPVGRVPVSSSFPSAHAATSFAGAVCIGTLRPRLRAPLLAAAALMALTRPYLGVHYPSDVAAGAAVGVIVGRAMVEAVW
jgi:membrane-associated phospholipid phosphatase